MILFSSQTLHVALVVAIHLLSPIASANTPDSPRSSTRASAVDAPRRRRRKSHLKTSTRPNYGVHEIESRDFEEASPESWGPSQKHEEQPPSQSPEQWDAPIADDPWSLGEADSQWQQSYQGFGDSASSQPLEEQPHPQPHEFDYNEGTSMNAHAEAMPPLPSRPLSVVESRIQTPRGQITVSVAAAVCGAAVGGAVNAYLIKNRPNTCVVVGTVVGLVTSVIGGNVGDLFRALAVTLLLTLERWRTFTGDYPFMRQLKCVLVRRRNRFPPHAPPNLRSYRATPEHPLEFSMPICMLSAGILGALMGYLVASSLDLFLLPPSFLALAVGIFLTFSATVETVEGDLVRCSAMKGAGLVRLVVGAATESEVPRKTLGLAGFVGTKIVEFDSRYRVKDRVFAAANLLFNRATGASDGGGLSPDRSQSSETGSDRPRQVPRRRRRRRTSTPYQSSEPQYDSFPY